MAHPPGIYIVDVTNRDGVQTAQLGLAKIEKTIVNMLPNKSAGFGNYTLDPRVDLSEIWRLAKYASFVKSGEVLRRVGTGEWL